MSKLRENSESKAIKIDQHSRVHGFYAQSNKHSEIIQSFDAMTASRYCTTNEYQVVGIIVIFLAYLCLLSHEHQEFEFASNDRLFPTGTLARPLL